MLGVTTCCVLLAVASLPAAAASPSTQLHGAGGSDFGVLWDAYSGVDLLSFDFVGTFPANGVLSAGALSGPGCSLHWGDPSCISPLSGHLTINPVVGSCVMSYATGRTINPSNQLFVPPATGQLTAQCTATVGSRPWSVTMHTIAVTDGDPTYSPASEIAPPPFSETYAGIYGASR